MLPRREIVELLTTTPFQDVIERADAVRKNFCGNIVHRRGIIEFSNVCIRSCDYCGLRGPNRAIRRYRMSTEEIVEAARLVHGKGLRTLVLQSGEDPYYSTEMICRVVAEIKSWGDTAVTLSLGVRPAEEYRLFREAGADRYLLKEETTDAALYARVHSGKPLAPRIRALCALKSLGFETGGGVMVGLPGLSAEMLADDLLLARELELDMFSVSPFIPHPNTPLTDMRPGALHQSLRMLAAARIVLEDAHLPATTALATLHPKGWEFGLLAGANVIMTSETPLCYRGDYEIYPNRISAKPLPEGHIESILRRLGRTVGTGVGGSLKREARVPSTDASADGVSETERSSLAELYDVAGALV